MAKRCIKIALNGQVFNSGDISDFSALTEQTGAVRLHSGSLPAWVSSLGDVAFTQGSSTRYTSENGSLYESYVDWGSNVHAYLFKAEGYSDYAQTTINTSGWVQSYFVFVVDDEEHKGWFIEITWYNQSTYLIDQVYNPNMYYYIGQEYVPYHWTSVPAISGKNGILRLSEIKDEFIGDGSPVEGAPLTNIESFSEASRVGGIQSQLDTDQVIDFIYSGEVYKMTIEKTSGVSVKVNFYLQPTTPGTLPSSIFTQSYAINGRRYFAMIKDD